MLNNNNNNFIKLTQPSLTKKEGNALLIDVLFLEDTKVRPQKLTSSKITPVTGLKVLECGTFSPLLSELSLERFGPNNRTLRKSEYRRVSHHFRSLSGTANNM